MIYQNLRYLIGLSLIIFYGLTYAEIFKNVDSAGHTTYSDQPLQTDAQTINLPPTNTVNNGPPNPASAQLNDETTNLAVDPNITMYTKLAIIQPIEHESIQNQPIMQINVEVFPILNPKHAFQLYLDGQAWGQPSITPSMQRTTPYRGTHHLKVRIIDASGLIIKTSSEVEFYVHQGFKQNNKIITRQR